MVSPKVFYKQAAGATCCFCADASQPASQSTGLVHESPSAGHGHEGRCAELPSDMDPQRIVVPIAPVPADAHDSGGYDPGNYEDLAAAGAHLLLGCRLRPLQALCMLRVLHAGHESYQEADFPNVDTDAEAVGSGEQLILQRLQKHQAQLKDKPPCRCRIGKHRIRQQCCWG